MKKLPVTATAALKRVNRILAKSEEQLRKNRGGPYSSERLPAWIRVDLNRNAIIGGTDDLEAFAREIGALKAWEKIAKED